MKTEYHVLSGGITSLLLIPVLGINSVVFWVASVLIDFDHYLDYLYRNNFTDFSVRRMFTFHKLLFEKIREPHFLGLSIIHSVEFVLLLYVIVALTGLASIAAVLWGLLFHIVLDLIYLYRQGALFKRALSIVEYVIRWNRLKRQGLCPESLYQSTIKAMSGDTEPLEDENQKAQRKD